MPAMPKLRHTATYHVKLHLFTSISFVELEAHYFLIKKERLVACFLSEGR